MGTSTAAQAGPYTYLRPCPQCSADNGITAELCWRCDAVLGYPRPRRHVAPQVPGASAADAPDQHDQAAAGLETRRQAEGEPSFFPVLREEVPDDTSAANDGPQFDPETAASFDDDQPLAPPPRSRSRQSAWQLLLAAAAIVAAIVVGPTLFDDTRGASPVAQRLAAPATLPAAAPVVATHAGYTLTADGRVAAVPAPRPAAPVAPPPGCTAAVVALGLCPAEAN